MKEICIRYLRPILVCSIRGARPNKFVQMMNLTYLTSMSNLLPNAFIFFLENLLLKTIEAKVILLT